MYKLFYVYKIMQLFLARNFHSAETFFDKDLSDKYIANNTFSILEIKTKPMVLFFQSNLGKLTSCFFLLQTTSQGTSQQICGENAGQHSKLFYLKNCK